MSDQVVAERGTNLEALLSLYLLQDWLRVERTGGDGPRPGWFRRHGVVPAMTSENRKVVFRLARDARCLHCERAIGEDSTGDHLVALANGGPGGAENYLPLCHRCNSSKQRMDFLEWWQRKGHRAAELSPDVLCAYVRLTYQLHQRLRTINKPAPDALALAVRELLELLPSAEHRDELWNRVQWVVGR